MHVRFSLDAASVNTWYEQMNNDHSPNPAQTQFLCVPLEIFLTAFLILDIFDVE